MCLNINSFKQNCLFIYFYFLAPHPTRTLKQVSKRGQKSSQLASTRAAHVCSSDSAFYNFFIQIVKSCFFFSFPLFIYTLLPLSLSAAQVPHPESKQLDPGLDSGGGTYKLDLNINNEPQALGRVSLNHAGLCPQQTVSFPAQPFDNHAALSQNISYYTGSEPVTRFISDFCFAAVSLAQLVQARSYFCSTFPSLFTKQPPNAL